MSLSLAQEQISRFLATLQLESVVTKLAQHEERRLCSVSVTFYLVGR